MADNAKIAADVLAAVGGKENVDNVMHCFTRLRFSLKDFDAVDDSKVKAIDGVIGTMYKGDQYQVVIGPTVPEVYKEVTKLGVEAGGSVDEDNTATDAPAEKKKLTAAGVGNAIIDYISGSVTPLIPVLITGALFKTLSAIFGSTMLNIFADDSEFIFICNMIYNAAFYFLPILVGAGAAKKLGMNSFMGAFMGCVLIEPNFLALVTTEGASFDVYGIPAVLKDYSSSVVPILLCIAVMAPINKFVEKHLPNEVRTVFAPFITMLIMLPLAFCLLAPLGNFIGEGIAAVLGWLAETPFGWLATTIIAAFWPVLVLTGMHLGLAAIALAQYAQNGVDTCILLAANIQTWAATGALLACCLRMRDKNKKGLWWSYTITQFLGGVGEPALFGVLIPYKRPLIAGIIGGAASGLYAAIMGVVLYTPIQGFAVPLSYVGGDAMNEVHGVIAMVIGAVVAFVVSWIWGLTPAEREGAEPGSTEIPAKAEA